MGTVVRVVVDVVVDSQMCLLPTRLSPRSGPHHLSQVEQEGLLVASSSHTLCCLLPPGMVRACRS